jgi:peptidoglycan L-alanyl-D-glutamate endopeptidase CwlK
MNKFGNASLAALAKCHPHLQDIALSAIREVDFRVLDATRGRKEQEEAFAKGNSKVHFGDSAHNYVPAIAFDLFPAPYDWGNKQSFIELSEVIFRIAREKDIALRWGGDWNRDGSTADGWDFPHYELHPWREWAKHAQRYED